MGLVSGINLVDIPASPSLVEKIKKLAPAIYDGQVHSGRCV